MSLVMRPRVVPGTSVDDTVISCGSISKAYRYCHAQSKPNFPVPATIDNADRACNYLFLHLCPHSKVLPCSACIDKFMDSIEVYYLYEEE